MLTSRERPGPGTRVSARVLARRAAALLLLSNEETDAEATAEEASESPDEGAEKARTNSENNSENNSYSNPASLSTSLATPAIVLSNVVIVGHSAGTVVGAAVATEQQDRSEDESGEGAAVVGLVFAAGSLFRAKSSLYSKSWLKPVFHWITTKLMANHKQSMAKLHHPDHAKRVLTDDLVEYFVVPTRLPNFNAALVETVMAKEAPYEELVDKLLSPPSTANKAAANPLPILFVWGKEDTYKPIPQLQIDSIRQKLDAINAPSSPQ